MKYLFLVLGHFLSFIMLMIMFVSSSSSSTLVASSIVFIGGILNIILASLNASFSFDYARALRQGITGLLKSDENDLPLWFFGYVNHNFQVWYSRTWGVILLCLSFYGFYKGITM